MFTRTRAASGDGRVPFWMQAIESWLLELANALDANQVEPPNSYPEGFVKAEMNPVDNTAQSGRDALSCKTFHAGIVCQGGFTPLVIAVGDPVASSAICDQANPDQDQRAIENSPLGDAEVSNEGKPEH